MQQLASGQGRVGGYACAAAGLLSACLPAGGWVGATQRRIAAPAELSRRGVESSRPPIVRREVMRPAAPSLVCRQSGAFVRARCAGGAPSPIRLSMRIDR
eukprot:GHVU01196203.1.p1 GENE.GHVU01196203.1~~GHVU01196203.1.p1  ORF type:complete len:100 (-),score=2.27 GHVU01196203.1:357-656(-)